MRRLFLIVLLLVVSIVAVGIVVLGAFPPAPHTAPVQKVLPNDRFGH